MDNDGQNPGQEPIGAIRQTHEVVADEGGAPGAPIRGGNQSADPSNRGVAQIYPMNPSASASEQRPASNESGHRIPIRPSNQQDGGNRAESPVGGLNSERELLNNLEAKPKAGVQPDQAHAGTKVQQEPSNSHSKGKAADPWIDNLTPYGRIERKFNGMFACHEDKDDKSDTFGGLINHKFSKKSLFCLTDTNALRRAFVFIATWSAFDTFITIVIILNSLMLASTDYEIRLNPDHDSSWTPIQEKIDLGFSITFIIEMLIKVIAMGFVFHKHSYLREAWNCLDFFIVCISIIGFLPISGGTDSLKALRTFRILRPLRSINKMPAMRDQIQALLGSIPGLTRVFFFIMFIFCIFAIFGTNQFLGQQYQFCRVPVAQAEFNEDGSFKNWPMLGDATLCKEDSDCTFDFPDVEGAVCGTVFEQFDVDPWEYDDIFNLEVIMYGIPGFDNVFQGFLTIFQILTLESWVYLMYNYSDTGSGLISVIFFVMVVLLGAFFTMNLVLAIIVDSFDQQSQGEGDEEEEEKAESVDESMKKGPTKQSDAISIKDHNQDLSEVDPDVGKDREGASTRNKQGNTLLPSLTDGGKSNEAAAQQFAQNQAAQDRGEHIMSDDDKQVEEENKEYRTDRASPEKGFGEISGIVQKGESLEKGDVKEVQKIVPESGRDEKNNDVKYFIDHDGTDKDTYPYEELGYEKDARLRSHGNGLYRCMFLFVTSVSFNFFIFILILGNTATLAAYTFDQSELQTQVLEIFNEFFTWIFFVEMIIKLIGLGFSNYKQDGYNVFDAVIVIISLIDWTISRVPNFDAGSALNAFRALRLLRMMKLSKSWKALQELLRKTLGSLKDISNFSVLLLLFMYIFALLGMELFANITLNDADGNLIAGEAAVQELYLSGDFYSFPRDNFNNVGFALTTVFIVIIGEDWNWTMYQWVRAYGHESSFAYHISVMYFVLLMILGNIVLFSVFTAILLRNFEGGDEDEEEEDSEAEEEEGEEGDDQAPKKGCLAKCCNAEAWEGCKTKFKEAFGKKKRSEPVVDVKVVAEEGEDHPIKADTLQVPNDNPLLLNLDQSHNSELSMSRADLDESGQERRRQKKLERANRNRRVSTLIHYDMNNTAIMRTSTIVVAKKTDETPVLQGVSLFCLKATNPFRLMCHRLAESKYFVNIILVLIIISTVTLALETPLDDPEGDKLTILGYIDLFMTAAFTFEATVKILALGFAFAGKTSYIRDAWNILDFSIVISALLGVVAGDAIDIAFIKALRILKILRPLRIISKNPKLKVAIISLGRSIPNIVNLQVIVLFFVFLFSILQTTILSGQFYYCETEHLSLSAKQTDQHIETMWDCYNYGGEWVEPELNFDTTFSSLLTLITIQTTEGWIDVMWNSVDAVNPYYQPKENANIFMIPYTMMLVIIICMLFLELFTGVVIETFNNQSALLSGNSTLQRSQRAWITVQLMTLEVKPKAKLEPRHSWLRNKCIVLTEASSFDMFIMVCIMANTFVLGFNWYMQPEYFELPIEIINYTFMAIFTIEAIVKIIAQRKLYFSDSWNLFDFTVVVLTVIILSLQWAGIGESIAIFGTILRTLRIGRVFRLIKKQQKLQEIFKTLVDAAPAMASLGLLLMLLIFMFAIIGMANFALIDLEGASEMNKHVNFQAFGASFLTLVRCSTGEAWNSIMFDSSKPRTILYQCVEDESFDAIVARGDDPMLVEGPKGCGTGFAIAFHLLFQVIVSQVFLNLFIAIIIDAFFGQTDLAQMPVQVKVCEDFKRVWQEYDKDGTHYMPVDKLEDLIMDCAKSDNDEAGALIPFKKRTADPANKEFRVRQIMALEIPTYKNMTQVMFYDVLQKLCHQQVKMYFQKDEIQKMQKQLTVLRRMGFGQNAFDDTLETLYSNNQKKNRYDRDFLDLLEMLKAEKPSAEVTLELQQKNKKFKKEYNHLVDTNLKILGEEKFGKLVVHGEDCPVELYTTLHLGSIKLIHEFIVEYLDRKANRARGAPGRGDSGDNSGRGDALNPIAEVSAHNEMTNNAAVRSQNNSQVNQSSGLLSGQKPQALEQVDQDDDENQESAIQDQAFQNQFK